MSETGDGVEVEMALGGFEPEEICVTAMPRELVVNAYWESKRDNEKKGDKSNIRWSEFHSVALYRRIALPSDVNTDEVSAEYNEGMLTITAKKAAQSDMRAKRVKVPSAA